MAVSKTLLLALLCQAALTSTAEESCTNRPDEQEGRAMLQVSDTSLASPKKHTPKQHSPKKHNPKAHSHKQRLATVKKTKTPDASNVALSESGYKTIANLCCPYEMEEFIRRALVNENLKLCDEGGLQGIVQWHTCEQKQNYTVLLTEIEQAGSGLCPWVAPKGNSCKKVTSSCGAVLDPMSHRRRNCGRNDNSQGLDLEMQNAATNEFLDTSCGLHQQYTDVSSYAGNMRLCKGIPADDYRGNVSAIKKCLKECCGADKCIGVSVTSEGISLQKNFEEAESREGVISYLHRQR